MALTSDNYLGPYEILAPLDAGLTREVDSLSPSGQTLFGRWTLINAENPRRMFLARSLRVFVVLPLFLCIFLAACVPVPMRTRVMPVTGEEQGAEPDTRVIHPGVTTRSEILHQFSAYDTGWKGERLWLGRWLRSGFSANASASNGRLWEGKNLVVEFDEKGTVTRCHVLSDKEFLHNDNSGLLTNEKDLSGFQQPASTQNCNKGDLPGNRQPACGATLKIVNVMGRDLLEVSGACPGGSFSAQLCADTKYRIAAEQIEGLSAQHWNNAACSAPRCGEVIPPVTSDFVLYIHLKERIRAVGTTEEGGKNGGAKTLRLDTDVPTVVLLVRFLHMSGVKQ
jgi:hypothetical protein